MHVKCIFDCQVLKYLAQFALTQEVLSDLKIVDAKKKKNIVLKEQSRQYYKNNELGRLLSLLHNRTSRCTEEDSLKAQCSSLLLFWFKQANTTASIKKATYLLRIQSLQQLRGLIVFMHMKFKHRRLKTNQPGHTQLTSINLSAHPKHFC